MNPLQVSNTSVSETIMKGNSLVEHLDANYLTSKAYLAYACICKGRILLDGRDLKSLDLKWLREQMGLVSQEPALFATTIASNILFGKRDADMDDVIQAAKAANAHSFIQGLPGDYDTQVRNYKSSVLPSFPCSFSS